MTADFTPDTAQLEALRGIEEWLDTPVDRPGGSPSKYLAGVAGSGKTTLAKHAVAGRRARFAAPTGKAALVLRSKGCEGATTIHSLIYRPQESYETGPDGTRRRVVKYSRNENGGLVNDRPEVVVADEMSMISAELARDLLANKTRVLWLGDPFQLPPIEGKGALADAKPDWLLDQVHRQAAGSGVLQLATDVRLGRPLRGDYGPDVRLAARDAVDPLEVFTQYDQVLCGTHRTRRALNRWVRDAAGVTIKTPVAGDKVVCRRNNADLGLINGSQWMVTYAEVRGKSLGNAVALVLESIDDPEPRTIQITSHPHHFMATYEDGDPGDALARMPWSTARAHNEMDYGYSRTVHSAQGSEWDSVAVVDESASFRNDSRRWLYTAATRASKRLLVLR